MAQNNSNAIFNGFAEQKEGISIGTGDISDTVGEMTERVATQGFRDRENNSVYDNNRRIQNAAAVISLALTDSYVNTDAEFQKSIANDPEKLQTYINNGAFGNPNAYSNLQQAMQTGSLINNDGRVIDLSSLNKIDMSSVMYAISQTGFQELVNTGNCQINLNLANLHSAAQNNHSLGGSLNGTWTFQAKAGTHVQELAFDYSEQLTKIEAFKNASGNRERADAIRNLRVGMTGYIQSLSPELASFDGSKKSYDKIMENAKISSDAKSILEQSVSKIGLNEDTSIHKNRQRQGQYLVSSYYLGQDIKTGINFYQQGFRTGALTVRAGVKAAYSMARNTSNFVSKTTGKLADKTGNQMLANMSANAEKIATNIQGRKNKMEARERMSRKEKRADNRRSRAVNKDHRKELREGRINKTESRIRDARNSGNKELEKRLSRKKTRQESRRDRLNVKDQRRSKRREHTRDRINEVKWSVANVFGKIGNSKFAMPFKWVSAKMKKAWSYVASPFKFVHTKWTNLKTAIHKALGKVIKKIASVVLMPMAYILLITILVTDFFAVICAIFPAFISSLVDNISSWAHALENINYVQLIANDIGENLEKEYLQVVQDDAVRYYSGVDDSRNAVPSYGVKWRAQITDATIGEMQDEYGTSISGISNTMQIASLMHYHMMDELTYTHYYTAEAYCYYLWLQSHHTGSADGSNPDYELKMDNFLCNELGTCSNVYYHDYDESLSLMVNQAKGTAKGVISDWMQSARNSLIGQYGNGESILFETALDRALNTNHTSIYPEDFVEDIIIPSSAYEGNCPAQYERMADDCKTGTSDEKNLRFVSCTVNADGSHVHRYECKKIQSVSNILLKELINDTKHDFRSEYEASGCLGEEHAHGDGACNTENCTHIHNGSCCSISEHQHTTACGTECCGTCLKPLTECKCKNRLYTWIRPDNCNINVHTHGDGNCNTSSCTHIHDGKCCSRKEHQHSEVCYAKQYTCPGHCGGHATPIVNLYTDTDWETLMYEDCICIDDTHWLTEDDFKISFGERVGDSIWNFVMTGNGNITLAQWTNIWTDKIQNWFKAIPSAKDAITTAGRYINSGVRSLVGKLFPEEETVENGLATVNDAFGFQGWFLKDGTINQTYLGDLKSLYGTKEEGFISGYQNWEDIGQVVFPMAGTMPVSAQTKAEILAILQDKYILTEREKAIVSAAMDGCGKFVYSLQNPQEGHAESGLIDCSGFVASVLYHSGIGWDNPTWTASAFAKAGSANSGTFRPGDVVAKNANSYYNGREWVGGGSNHVVIYLGYFEKGQCPYPGAEEAGHYVIDCSSSEGGAKIRLMNNVTLYERVYRP